MSLKGAALGLAIASAIGTLTACSSSTTTASTNCPAPQTISDPDIAAAVRSVTLPGGGKVIAGRVDKDSNHPGMVGVAIDLCGIKDVDTADELRPIATQLAHAVKASPKGGEVFAMWVNLDFYKDGKIDREVKLKDDAFDVHLWDGKAVCCVEDGSWKVLAE